MYIAISYEHNIYSTKMTNGTDKINVNFSGRHVPSSGKKIYHRI